MARLSERWVGRGVSGAREIPFDIREAILGSRRRVLFIEGDEQGLDYGLYNLLIKDISVTALGTSREVEQAVLGARGLHDFEWLMAWGIIDRDGRSDAQIAELRARGIWCIPVYSVESIYYHPKVIGEMSRRSVDLHGGSPDSLMAAAQKAACTAIEPHIDRLAKRAVEKTVREEVLSAVPKWQELSECDQISVPVNPRGLYEKERAAVCQTVNDNAWEHIVARCPIRESPALRVIATAIGFQSAGQYESAARKALIDDETFRAVVLQLLGEPPAGLLK